MSCSSLLKTFVVTCVEASLWLTCVLTRSCFSCLGAINIHIEEKKTTKTFDILVGTLLSELSFFRFDARNESFWYTRVYLISAGTMTWLNLVLSRINCIYVLAESRIIWYQLELCLVWISYYLVSVRTMSCLNIVFSYQLELCLGWISYYLVSAGTMSCLNLVFSYQLELCLLAIISCRAIDTR